MCVCVWWGVYALVVHERSLAKFARVQSCFTRLKFARVGSGGREGVGMKRGKEAGGRGRADGDSGCQLVSPALDLLDSPHVNVNNNSAKCLNYAASLDAFMV